MTTTDTKNISRVRKKEPVTEANWGQTKFQDSLS